MAADKWAGVEGWARGNSQNWGGQGLRVEQGWELEQG